MATWELATILNALSQRYKLGLRASGACFQGYSRGPWVLRIGSPRTHCASPFPGSIDLVPEPGFTLLQGAATSFGSWIGPEGLWEPSRFRYARFASPMDKSLVRNVIISALTICVVQSPGKGPHSPAGSVVVRMPSIGAAENAACFSYSLLTGLTCIVCRDRPPECLSFSDVALFF
jgi:hypothetical protein